MRLEGLDRVLRKLDAPKPAGKRGLMQGGIYMEGAIKGDRRVLTGRDRASWATREDGDRVIVGTNVEYSPFVGGVDMPTGFEGAGEAHLEELVQREKQRVLEIVQQAVREAWR